MIEPYYDEGGVTIYHGDAREILPHLGSFPVVFADPPYAFGQQRPEWRMTSGVAIALNMAAQRVKPKGTLFGMTAASGRGIDYMRGAIEPTLSFNRLLIWHKEFVNSPVAGPWRWDIVPILVFGRGSFGRPAASSCFRSNGQNPDTSHPAGLPLGLGRWLLASFEGSVLDPFMGSGSVVVAAREQGMKAVGIDREERYCEMAAQRLQQEVLAV